MMGETLIRSQPETQADRIEHLLRELHRDFRGLKQEVATVKRLIEHIVGKE